MGLAETAQMAVRIGLDDKLSPGLKKASGNLSHFESSTKRVGGGITKLAGGLTKVGLVAGGAVATGLALAAKTAIDFDDAFASVRKNVEGTPKQIDAVNTALHGLATRIPVSYQDLAAIAGEAGALGVAAPDVVHFTEVVARLSASTQGLTVEAASEAFGKFRNILHLTGDQMDRAASSLIALGKGGASSEGDIIEISKRFAGAGRVAGLSASQILALSSAIASVGVAPEAAGSSLSRLFNNIVKYIGTGNVKVKTFAKTTGESVKAFSKSFATDATGTVLDFLSALGKLDKFKQAAVLKNAGIINVRDISAVQLLSQNIGEVRRQLKLSDQAFKDNTQLSTTSNQRFDTLAKKLTVLKNNFKEAAYNIAEGFLPALGRATDKLIAFLQVPANKSALQDIGKQIGGLIDGIDWNALEKGAKGAVDAIKPMVELLVTVAKTLNALPAEVKGAGLALLVANKVSGGAIGGGIGQIVGGLGETLARTLASKIPVFGKAFVQPVFVTNMGAGFGGPGAAAGEVGATGAAAFFATAAAGGALFALGDRVAKGVEDAIISTLPKAIQDSVRTGASGSRTQAFGGVEGALNFLTDPGGTVSKMTDAVNQLSTFVNSPHPDFLGDLGKLAFLQYQPNGAPGSMDTGPGTRDGDKNLPSSASVIQHLGDIGINLGRIANGKKEIPGLNRQLYDVTRFWLSARKRGDTEAVKLWAKVGKSLRTEIETIRGHGPKEKDGNVVTNAIHRLRDKLTLTIEREGRAERDGRNKTAKLLAGKEEAIRAAIRRLEAPHRTDPTGPTPRDMDKHLGTPASVFKNLKKDGINLGAIAQNRRDSLGPSIHQLRERLSAVLHQEARAERAGETRTAARLAHKSDELRSQITHLTAVAAAKLAANKAEQARTTAAARATERVIAAKKLAVTVHTTVNASTAVSITSIQKAAKISSRVARTTAFGIS